jgi:hypothetical protein
MTPVHPKLAARRQRIHRIRVTVAAVAAALFIALFSTIYVQMAAGRDPVLGSSAQTAQVSTTSSSTSSDDSSSSGERLGHDHAGLMTATYWATGGRLAHLSPALDRRQIGWITGEAETRARSCCASPPPGPGRSPRPPRGGGAARWPGGADMIPPRCGHSRSST